MEDGKGLNLAELDKVVLDYASFERLISPVPHSYKVLEQTVSSRALIRFIRTLLKNGNIEAAIDKISELSPDALQNQRLLFYLHKQKFIELLRTGKREELYLALNCARTCLAPCALHAYPEAYAEFKRCMLTLLFNSEDSDSPVSVEWSDLKNHELAGIISSTLTSHLQAYDSKLSLIIRYLMTMHNSLCYRRGLNSPHQEVIDQLVLKTKDLQPLVIENNQETTNFQEIDIQNLVHAVNISRHESMGSLKHTQGDLFLAFKNELSRIPIQETVLDRLVKEYCIFRGLVNGTCSNHEKNIDKNKKGEIKVNVPSTQTVNENGMQSIRNSNSIDYDGDDDGKKMKDDGKKMKDDGSNDGLCLEMDLDKNEEDHCTISQNEMKNGETENKDENVNSLQTSKYDTEEEAIIVHSSSSSSSSFSSSDVIMTNGVKEFDCADDSNRIDFSQNHVIVEIKQEIMPEFKNEGEDGVKNNGTFPLPCDDFLGAKNVAKDMDRVEDKEKTIQTDVNENEKNKKMENEMQEGEVKEGSIRKMMMKKDKMDVGFECCLNGNVHVQSNDNNSKNSSNNKSDESMDEEGKEQYNSSSSPSLFVDYVWKGRNHSSLPLSNEFSSFSSAEKNSKSWDGVDNDNDNDNDDEDEFGRYCYHIHRLIKEGCIDSVIDLLRRINSQFFETNFELLFLLKQVSFMQAMKQNDLDRALTIAKSELGALSTKHPSLFPSLRATLFALANPGEEAHLNLPTMDEIANLIMTHIYKQLGKKIPKLVAMMNDLVIAHSDWLKLNQCDDELASGLGIYLLKSPSSASVSFCSGSDHLSESKTWVLSPSPGLEESESFDSWNGGRRADGRRMDARNDEEGAGGNASNGWNVSSSPSPSPPSSSSPSPSSPPVSETSILRIMEVMEIPRGDAIELLSQFNGNVDDLFLVIYG